MGKYCFGKCPTHECNTLRPTQKDLGKNIQYHRHLTDEEKQISHNKSIDRKINRLGYYQHGLPNGDEIMASGKRNTHTWKNNGDVQFAIIEVVNATGYKCLGA